MTLSNARTIPALLKEQSALGEHPAVVEKDKTTSYSELWTLVQRAAKGYLAAGVTHGERVAIWAPNSLEFIVSLLGAQTIGAAAVPISTRFTGHEALEVLSRSGTHVLAVTDGFLNKSYTTMLKDAAADLGNDGGPVPGLPSLRKIIRLDNTDISEEETAWGTFLGSGDAISDDTLKETISEVVPDDVVDILYTSGTTGAPKGVMSAHRQTIAVAYAWAKGAELTAEDDYAIVNPMFHGFGYKAGVIAALVAGSTIHPVPVLDTTALLELIQTEKITVLPGVPTIFTSLLDHPNLATYDTSSLRFAIAGATTAPESLFRDMVDILGFSTVAQAYGLTECVVATMSRPREDLGHVQQTTGPAVHGTEIRIVDHDGNNLPTGTDGEVLLRGENVMLGYFEDPEATAAAIDSDGWFHTGDAGRLDEHGCLKITDRLKDMFIVGGFNVYPAEVENVLRQHPAVNESAVIGVPDDRLGSVGVAYVRLLADAAPVPSEEELEAFCRKRVSNYKVPREVIIVSDFPRSSTGKILKKDLREDA